MLCVIVLLKDKIHLTVCNHIIVVLLREHLCMVKLSSCMLYVYSTVHYVFLVTCEQVCWNEFHSPAATDIQTYMM